MGGVADGAAEDRVRAFEASMAMDYEKWHDGIGYDVGLIEAMTPEEKSRVESMLLSRAVSDWRDLEALEALKSPKAIEAILKTRESGDSQLRLAAQRYGPAPKSDDRESAILKALRKTDLYDGLSEAIDEAVENPTPKIEAALLNIVRSQSGAEAYSAAAALYFIHGKIESHLGFENREFFLRLAEPDGDDRRSAVHQLEQELWEGVPPA